MVAFEKNREATRLATEAKLRTRFLDGPTLTLPVADKFNFAFDPNGAVPISGLGTVYEASRISDVWGTLEVSSGGVLLRRADTGPITGVVLSSPIAKDGKISGQGWTLTLSPGWSAKEVPGKAGSMTVSRDGAQ
jgi:hypothetical protein